jgi:hypothetical protein
MDRQEYPTMAVSDTHQTTRHEANPVIGQATLEPGQAISVLNDRVRQVGRLNSDIAEWLQVRLVDRDMNDELTLDAQERRRLEEQYSSGLRKLARRPPPGESAADLG